MVRTFLIFALGFLAACQGYDPQPLDPAAHEREWRGRDPDAPLAADYARRLATSASKPVRYNIQDGVSLAEAEIIALFFHPELRRIRAEAGIALAGAEEAGHWEDPELEISAERILASVSNPWILGGMISFTLPLSGRHGVEEDKAWAEHRLALTHVVQAEWNALARLREHWVAASAAAEELRLVRGLIADLEKLKTIADRLAQGGALTRLDARLIELELAARRIEAFGLESQVANDSLQLREDIGLHPNAALALVLDRAAVAAPAQPSQLMRERNPALRAARARYDVSEQSLRLEVRKQYPDIVIGGGAGIEDGQSRIGIGLGLPIPIINLNKEGIARARAERVEARAAWEAAVEAATHALARAELRAQRAAQQAAQVRETLVPLADTQAAEAARLAELGEFDALRQLDVLTRQHEARVALLRADTLQREANTALLQAVGPEWKEAEEEK